MFVNSILFMSLLEFSLHAGNPQPTLSATTSKTNISNRFIYHAYYSNMLACCLSRAIFRIISVISALGLTLVIPPSLNDIIL